MACRVVWKRIRLNSSRTTPRCPVLGHPGRSIILKPLKILRSQACQDFSSTSSKCAYHALRSSTWHSEFNRFRPPPLKFFCFRFFWQPVGSLFCSTVIEATSTGKIFGFPRLDATIRSLALVILLLCYFFLLSANSYTAAAMTLALTVVSKFLY